MVRLPVPPSTNNLFANGKHGRWATDKYVAWQKEAGWMLQAARPTPFGSMKVQVTLCVPRKPASRDLDNFCKAPLDLLVKHKVIADDKHIEELTVRRHDDPDMIVSVMPFGSPSLESRMEAARRIA
jgi:crossover junction endodeoxyribonuclease RusA